MSFNIPNNFSITRVPIYYSPLAGPITENQCIISHWQDLKHIVTLSLIVALNKSLPKLVTEQTYFQFRITKIDNLMQNNLEQIILFR